MRCVGVAVAAAAVVAALAAGGPRYSFANMEKEAVAAQDSDEDDEQDEEVDDETDEDEQRADDREYAKSAPKKKTEARRKTEPAEAKPNIERDLVPEHVLFFSGAEVWRHGLFSHSGIFWAYNGFDGDGPVLKVLLNSGLYRYYSGRKEIIGFQAMGAFMPGWRWHGRGLEFTVFGGLDAQDHRFLPNDPGNRLRGTHVGARGGFDAWFEPVENAMITVSASASTVGKSYWMRAAAGGRFLDMIWIGPEFLASGDERYSDMRIGGHITSVRISSYEFSLGAGWAKDNDGRSSLYGRLGVLYRPFGGASYPERPVPF